MDFLILQGGMSGAWSQSRRKTKTPRLTPGRFDILCGNRSLVAASAAAATTPTAATTAAATAAAAVVAASAAATTTTAATAEGATAAAATWAIFAGTRFIDGQRTAMESLAVEKADGLLCFLVAGHGDEGKAAGLARELILHQSGFGDAACLGEEVLQVHFWGVEGKIPDVEFVTHLVCLLFREFRVAGVCFRLSDFKLPLELRAPGNAGRTQLAIYQGLN